MRVRGRLLVQLTHAPLFTKRPQSANRDPGSSQTSKRDCWDDGEPDIIDANIEILYHLRQAAGPLADVIRCAACSEESEAQTDKVVVLRVRIVWETGAPTFSRDGKKPKAHTCAATPRHLMLMRETGHGRRHSSRLYNPSR
ncbi:hypothetical protein F4824DRAFT_292530 [Ustulina deusta]|nr:hypothetical protein F4824DRAFT_292530 [Ustulina deusta]